MGSELSCPCGDRNSIEEEVQPKEKIDIVEEIMRGKLTAEQIIYEYTYDQSKVCLIKVSQVEGFFANRQLLKLSTKKEINYYYNMIFITNFLANGLIFVLLQYTPGMEDKSFINSSFNKSIFNKSKIGSNRKRNTTNLDYSMNYKIEKLNLVSNEKSKVATQLLNDLNSNVKKDFLLYGIINDYDLVNEVDFNNISNVNLLTSHNSVSSYSPRIFKLLYKRSLLKDTKDCKYSIYQYEGQLDREILNSILSDPKNKHKSLKSIMIDCPDSSLLKKNYYFIFEENLTTPEDEFDYLVIEMEQGNNSNRIFLQDVAKKLNDYQNPFKLCCILNDEKKFYLILYANSELLDFDTPYDQEIENFKSTK